MASLSAVTYNLTGYGEKKLLALDLTTLRKMITERNIETKSKSSQRKTCVKLLLIWKDNLHKIKGKETTKEKSTRKSSTASTNTSTDEKKKTTTRKAKIETTKLQKIKTKTTKKLKKKKTSPTVQLQPLTQISADALADDYLAAAKLRPKVPPHQKQSSSRQSRQTNTKSKSTVNITKKKTKTKTNKKEEETSNPQSTSTIADLERVVRRMARNGSDYLEIRNAIQIQLSSTSTSTSTSLSTLSNKDKICIQNIIKDEQKSSSKKQLRTNTGKSGHLHIAEQLSADSNEQYRVRTLLERISAAYKRNQVTKRIQYNLKDKIISKEYDYVEERLDKIQSSFSTQHSETKSNSHPAVPSQTKTSHYSNSSIFTSRKVVKVCSFNALKLRLDR